MVSVTYLLVADDALNLLKGDALASYQAMLHWQHNLSSDEDAGADSWTAQGVVCLCYGPEDSVLLRHEAEWYLGRYCLKHSCTYVSTVTQRRGQIMPDL